MSNRKKRPSKLTSIIAEEIQASMQPPAPPVVAAPPVPPPVVAPLTNHIVFLLDGSGSMDGCYAEAVRQINKQFATVRERARATSQITTVSLYLFGTSVQRVYFKQPVESLRDLSVYDRVTGSTALNDCIGDSVTDMLGSLDANDPNTSFLLICLTDGQEYMSRRYSGMQASQLLRRVQGTDRWTHVFMVPPGNTHNVMSSLGVPQGNIIEWTNDLVGAAVVGNATNQGISQYYTSRSTGQKSTKQFYTTNLSALSASDLAKMADVSRNFKKWEVSKEEGIKAFVEDHGTPFVIGAGYYLLMKKELLRVGRQVLVQEKGSTRLYGGADARRILGIPDGEVLVTPGNHANFDIYLQSTSVNRVLVRGTKFFYDLTQQPGLIAETWDSAAAIAAAEAKKAAQPTV